ncbi:hypothetical protein WJX84_008519 [Apatococcus fuscideae]|uniref:EF-hand domain-containing protein n=1 Tax=Apatococcus fuscideae TaxID=2026836 RepID=A0AAW1S0I4_9CHLO
MEQPVAFNIHLLVLPVSEPLALRRNGSGSPKLQDKVWNRHRNIPSSRNLKSVLDNLFDEFDKDGDGHLTPAEIASALNSRNVLITEQESAMFIRAIDANSNGLVERSEWPGFIWAMAAADLSPDNLDVNLPRCVTEPQVELDIEPRAELPFLKDPSTPRSLHSWFQLRTQYSSGQAALGPSIPGPGPNAQPSSPRSA